MIIGFKNHGLLIRFVIIFFCLNTYSFGEVTNSLARFNLIESFEADFTQKVFDGESTVEEIVKGKFIFKRPANFLWISDSPYNQQIKSDGEYLSIYDVDFEQNIIRSLSDEIKHSPLYMLFNDVSEISNEYLIEENKLNSHTVLNFTNRNENNNVESFSIKLESDLIKSLSIMDRVSGQFEINFEDIEINKYVDSSIFDFRNIDNTQVFE